MAITLNILSGITTPDGDVLSSAYCRVETNIGIYENQIGISLNWWRDETAFNTNKRKLEINEIPFNNLGDTLSPTQYANVDMTIIQNVVASILEDGDTHPKYPSGAGSFSGFGSGSTTVIMPS